MNDLLPAQLQQIFNSPINEMNGYESTFVVLLSVTLIGSAVVVATLLLQRLLKRHVSAKFLYLLWAIVILRFVLVWAPASPTSVFNLMPTTIGSSPAVVEPVLVPHPLARSTEIVTETLPMLSGFDAADEVTHTQSPPSSASYMFPIIPVILAVWLAGFAYCLIRLFAGQLQLSRLISRCVEAPAVVLQAGEELKRELNITRRVRFLMTEELGSPAMAGLWRPIVFLTRESVDRLSKEELKMILTHELIHIRRWDGVIQLVSYLITSLHWFNPFVRLAAARIESFRELSCDAAVVARLAGDGSDELLQAIHRSYGSTILKLATMSLSKSDTKRNSSQLLIHGFINSHDNDMKERISMLINPTHDRLTGRLFGLLSVAAIIAIGFTTATTVGQDEAQTTIANPPIANPPIANPPIANPPIARPPTANSPTPFWTTPAAAEQNAEKLLPKPQFRPAKPQAEPYKKVGGSVGFQGDRVHISMGETKKVTFEQEIPKVVVIKPEFLNIQPVGPKTLMLSGIKPGLTTFDVTLSNGKTRHIAAEILCDTAPLQRTLETTFPKKRLQVVGTPSNIAILRGAVKTDQEAKEIETLVNKVTDLVIVNQLVTSKTIALEVKVYEVSRSKLKNLGVDVTKLGLNKDANGENAPAGLPHSLESIRDIVSSNPGRIKTHISREGNFEAFVDGLVRNDIAKLLDQPVLVARTGQPAEFLSGGEIPFRVITEGQQSVDFRPFGTRLKAQPVEISETGVTLEIQAEFSEIDDSLSNGSGVPGFRVRRINTGAQMKFGQALVIAGDFKGAGSVQKKKSAKENADEAEAGKTDLKDDTDIVFIVRPRLIKASERQAEVSNPKPQTGFTWPKQNSGALQKK